MKRYQLIPEETYEQNIALVDIPSQSVCRLHRDLESSNPEAR